MRLNLGNDQHLYFSTFPDYTLTDGQFSLNGFFALKINIQKDRFVGHFLLLLLIEQMLFDAIFKYEIEEQTEAVECRNVTFCPVSVDDWEILVNSDCGYL